MSKKRNLLIRGSSNLVPNAPEWNVLRKTFEIEFGEFGNIILSDNAKNYFFYCYVLFAQDWLNDFEKNKDVSNLLKQFLTKISHSLETNEESIIICYSTYFPLNLVEQAQFTNPFKTILYSFENELKILTNRFKNLFVVNLDQIFGLEGFNKSFSNRNWYFAHTHLSKKGLELVAESISTITNRIFTAPRKLLLLDCDNTLWGGIAGDSAFEDLKIGQDGEGTIFQDFQHVIKQMQSSGLLLGLVSKNNAETVWKVFNEHSGMILKQDQIASYRINWESKVENIKQIAAELDLTLESIAFWDDNPLERDLVRLSLPEVYTIEPPVNLADWPKYLRESSVFTKFKVTEEDKNKTRQYLARASFVSDLKVIEDKELFLKSICLKPQAVKIEKGNLGRAEQLSLKTNQFNLTNRRYTATEIMDFSGMNKSFLVSLSDKYGDHGNVGLIILEHLSDTELLLNTFIMSCRVFGRHLESWMLSFVTKEAKNNGYANLIAEYFETKANSVALNFLESHGFKQLTFEEYKSYANKLKSSESKVYKLSTEISNIPYIDAYE